MDNKNKELKTKTKNTSKTFDNSNNVDELVEDITLNENKKPFFDFDKDNENQKIKEKSVETNTNYHILIGINAKTQEYNIQVDFPDFNEDIDANQGDIWSYIRDTNPNNILGIRELTIIHLVFAIAQTYCEINNVKKEDYVNAINYFANQILDVIFPIKEEN